MGIFETLARRAAKAVPAPRPQLPPDDAVAGFGTPAGMGGMGGAKDVERTGRATRTHTGALPAQFVEPVAVTEEQRRTIAMAASVLLRYPEADFGKRVALVREQLTSFPNEVAADITAFLDWADELGARGLEEHYVEVFDQRRRCSLFLSYYAVGDTRQRGMAILSFGEQLEALGFQLDSDELPDHLCVVLEALALSEGEAHGRAVEMLASYRDGIEVLRAALDQLGSPYVNLVVAICRVLPKVDPETAQKYVDLIRTGPPAEMVGIADLPFPTSQPDIT